MSFDLNEVRRLELAGGAALAKYQRLLGEADQALHGSPAHQALGEFCKQWEQDPNRAMEVARNEVAARAEAAEAAAKAAG
jgi:hypothetical protein